MGKHKKHRCCCCDSIAVWENEFNDKRARYYCDKCVPRGSITNVDNIEDMGEPTAKINVMWWGKESSTKELLKDGSTIRKSDSFYYEELDERGRRNPSDDYLYDKDGFEICRYEPQYGISYDDIKESLDDASWNLSFKFLSVLNDVINEIFLSCRIKPSRIIANYNKFLSTFGNYLNKHSVEIGVTPITVSSIKEFYTLFKKGLQEKKVKM